MKYEGQVKETLDTRGLYCPLPILKASKTIEQMGKGEVLKVLSTDPGSKRDFESWCRRTGNKLLETTEENGVFTYIIEKVS
jgi:tRNA 2-thiouridine synthesizing protein A